MALPTGFGTPISSGPIDVTTSPVALATGTIYLTAVTLTNTTGGLILLTLTETNTAHPILTAERISPGASFIREWPAQEYTGLKISADAVGLSGRLQWY